MSSENAQPTPNPSPDDAATTSTSKSPKFGPGQRRLAVFAAVLLTVGAYVADLVRAGSSTPSAPPLRSGAELIAVGTRHEVGGVSVLGPRGALWRKLSNARPLALDFFREFEDRVAALKPEGAHSVLLSVEVHPFQRTSGDAQALLGEQIASIIRAYDRGRFNMVTSDSRADRVGSADCRRYDIAVTDNGVPGFPGSTFSFVMHGILCIHPQQPQIVRIEHSERFLVGQAEYGAVKAEVEPVFSSLQFLNKALPATATASPRP